MISKRRNIKYERQVRYPGSKQLLRFGDIVMIERGMTVYTQIPMRFVYSNERDKDVSVCCITDILIGCQLNDERGHVYRTGKISGKYVVTETSFCGGDTGHGPQDVYPNGYKVILQKLNDDGSYDDKNIVISFYQTGCFTAMITPEEIAPIGKMRRIFV